MCAATSTGKAISPVVANLSGQWPRSCRTPYTDRPSPESRSPVSQKMCVEDVAQHVLTCRGLSRRSMFVSDRSFFMRDPARSLYSTAAYYLSIMTVNAAVTIINAAFLVLLMYGMIGESCLS